MEVIDCTHERTESMLGLLGGVLQFGMQSMFGFQGAPCDDYRVCPELGYQMQTNLSARKLAEENNSGIFDVHGNVSEAYPGSLQGLIQSFNAPKTGALNMELDNQTRVSGGEKCCAPGRDMDMNLNVLHVIPEINDNARIPEKTNVWDIDESGYMSSGSSIYDVDSDDEDFNNICSSPTDNSVINVYEGPAQEGLNLTGNDGEMNNTTIINEARQNTTNAPINDCPCMAGKPFLHVMAQEAKGDNRIGSWKKGM